MNKKSNLSTSKREKKPKAIKIVNIIIVIFAFIMFFPYVVGLYHEITTQAPYLVIRSDSMNPVIYKGDFLLINKVPPENITIGTIIAFDTRGCWQEIPDVPIVIHRVVGKEESPDGIWEFTTKGDANDRNDDETVSEFCIIGKLMKIIPKIGWIVILIDEWNLKFLLIFLVFFSIIINFFWHLVKKPIKILYDIFLFIMSLLLLIYLI